MSSRQATLVALEQWPSELITIRLKKPTKSGPKPCTVGWLHEVARGLEICQDRRPWHRVYPCVAKVYGLSPRTVLKLVDQNDSYIGTPSERSVYMRSQFEQLIRWTSLWPYPPEVRIGFFQSMKAKITGKPVLVVEEPPEPLPVVVIQPHITTVLTETLVTGAEVLGKGFGQLTQQASERGKTLLVGALERLQTKDQVLEPPRSQIMSIDVHAQADLVVSEAEKNLVVTS